MKSLRLSAKSLLPMALMGAFLSVHAAPTFAQTTFLDPNTNLRALAPVPTVNADGSTSGAYAGRPGCSPVVQSSLNSTAAYTLSTQVAVHVNTVQQPTSLSSCLSTLMKQAAMFNNVFTGDGFSFTAIFNNLISQAATSILSNFENAACADVERAAQGVFGSIATPNYNVLKTGGVLITLTPGSTGSILP